MADVAGPLAQLEVLVVDCQTTGASPALGSILELGWCVARADDAEREALAEAHWIVPPSGERISAQVRQLTGFRESMLDSALTPEMAWQRLRGGASATPSPAAIHFARFELSFLRDWCERFEPGATFPLEAVCLHGIACRLYPDLPRRNLRALAGFLGHSLHLERRALGHVRATAFIWRKLVGSLAERGVHTWPELRDWLSHAERPAKPRRRRYPLAPASYRALPEQPGVYRFLRSNGDVLYVGKAASLKKRVSSHFTKHRGATERALEMLTQVSEIAFTPTVTALEAALLEARTINSSIRPTICSWCRRARRLVRCTDLADARAEPDAEHDSARSRRAFSLRWLGASAVAVRRAPTRPCAQSVGAPYALRAGRAVLAACWALFAERHVVRRRWRALRVAERSQSLTLARDHARRPESDDGAPKQWDAPRVCRHLERAAAQSYRSLARQLAVLTGHSDRRLPRTDSDRPRTLALRAPSWPLRGARRGAGANPPRASATRRSATSTQLITTRTFLTTELKRILPTEATSMSACRAFGAERRRLAGVLPYLAARTAARERASAAPSALNASASLESVLAPRSRNRPLARRRRRRRYLAAPANLCCQHRSFGSARRRAGRTTGSAGTPETTRWLRLRPLRLRSRQRSRRCSRRRSHCRRCCCSCLRFRCRRWAAAGAPATPPPPAPVAPPVPPVLGGQSLRVTDTVQRKRSLSRPAGSVRTIAVESSTATSTAWLPCINAAGISCVLSSVSASA